jgi:hypothetical protein
MKAHEVRARLFNRKLQGKDVDFSIPGCPELDGQLYITELTARDSRIITKLARMEDGTTDPIVAQAATVCRALRLKETKERIFGDLDIDAIAGNDKDDGGVGADAPVDGFGTFVLKLLGDEIGKLSGFEPDAMERAKADFLQTHSVNSNSHSTETSVVVLQAST